MFQTKAAEKIEHILCLISFSENRAAYEKMWKNIVQRGRPQMTIRRTRTAYWIPKATNAHTVCVILTAFTLQQWLHERASLLLYTYIADCLVCFPFDIRTPKDTACKTVIHYFNVMHPVVLTGNKRLIL
jgi:hypothetical protein